MIHLAITTNLDIAPWTDLLQTRPDIAQLERIGLLPNSTENRRACVEMVGRLPNGQFVIVETTWALFHAAARALAATPIAEMEGM